MYNDGPFTYCPKCKSAMIMRIVPNFGDYAHEYTCPCCGYSVSSMSNVYYSDRTVPFGDCSVSSETFKVDTSLFDRQFIRSNFFNKFL